MKKFILLLILLLPACEIMPTGTTGNSADLNYESYETCKNPGTFWAGSNEALAWEEDGLRGQYTLKGQVKTLEQAPPFGPATEENSETHVYLVVDPTSNEAATLLYEFAGNGSVDKVVDEKLYFKLGVLQAGQLLSDATISEEDKAKILDSIDKSAPLTASMNTVSELGHGGSATSVTPCVIILR